MPLRKLAFKPGINRDQTNYASEGGWFEGDKIRFRSGFPEKIGGWTVSTNNQYLGFCRSLLPYSVSTSAELVGVATNTKTYVWAGTSLLDITPLRATFTNASVPSTANCISTTSGSTTATITYTGANTVVGEYVTFSGVSSFGGIAANAWNREYRITSSPSANSFSFNLGDFSGTGTIGFSATGSISGTTLTVTAVSYGVLSIGDEISGTGISPGTTITALGTGLGGTGTYTISSSYTLSSRTITGASTTLNITSVDQTFSAVGSILGNILTITSITSGTVSIGNVISGTGVYSGTVITDYLDASGGVGTYVISIEHDELDSRTISGIGALSVNAPVTGSGVTANTYITSVSAGTSGVGTYTVNSAQTVAATTISNKATSTVASGGGSTITIALQVFPGSAQTTAGYGWGTGTWGRGTWGSGSSVPIYSPARLMFQDQYFDNLYFNYRDETGATIAGSAGTNIYYWVYDSAFSSRAVALTSATDSLGAAVSPAPVAVPRQVGQILFAPSGHLLALGCTSYNAAAASPDYVGTYDPLLIRWSNVDPYAGPQPQVWQPTLTNTAGDLRVSSGSRIVCGLRTRQEILIFTDFTLNSLQFTGTQEVFGLQQLDSNISIAGPNTVIVVNGIAYWMGVDKFYMYSGRVDTLPCTLRQYVFQNMNMNAADLFFCGSNAQFNEIVWFYATNDPSSTEPNRYVIYNYSENIWYYGQLSRTYWTDAGFVVNPVAAYNGWIYAHENGTDDGQPPGFAARPISSYIKSADFDIDDGDQFMLTRRIIPDVNFTNSTATNATAFMEVGVRNFPGATTATTNVEGESLEKNVVTTATVDQYTNQVFLRARGRQMSFKIGSNDLGVQWQVGFPRLDARPDGRRGGENP